MFPERFSEEAVQELEKTLGSYASAGQLQQRPAPRGGALFKREDFNVVASLPQGCRMVRGWDLAATDDPSAAWTAGALLAQDDSGRLYLADMVRIQGTAAQVEALLKSTAAMDGVAVRGSIPQDPGQAGKMQAQYLVRQLAGFDYRASPESGDKFTRAMPFAAQVEAGNVFLVRGEWNRAFLDEAATFPNGKWKDQIDAVTRAFDMLVVKQRPKAQTSYVGGMF